jgi:hypothetical protein
MRCIREKLPGILLGRVRKVQKADKIIGKHLKIKVKLKGIIGRKSFNPILIS